MLILCCKKREINQLELGNEITWHQILVLCNPFEFEKFPTVTVNCVFPPPPLCSYSSQ